MRSFLEPKPKFGVNPFIKLFCTGIPYTHLNLRLPLKIAVPSKNTDYRRWHFGPSQLLLSFVFTYLKNLSCGGL